MSGAHDNIIREWMLNIIKDGGINRFDDIHIDKIDYNWASRILWLEGGLEALSAARRLRDFHRLPFTVALAIPFRSENTLKGLDFTTRKELATRLDDFTPPSLYLLVRGEEPWITLERAIRVDKTHTGLVVANPNLDLFRGAVCAKQTYYLEFRMANTDREYPRCLWIVG